MQACAAFVSFSHRLPPRSLLCNTYVDMISVEHLSVEFSARPLFTDVSFVINPKDRIALVGKNGAGKSTLLKIL